MQRSLARLRHKMYFLGERDAKRALDLQECLNINRLALTTITYQTSHVPSRLGLSYPNHPNKKSNSSDAQDWTLVKPAAYYGDGEDANAVDMGMKVISLRSQNPSIGLPTAPATIFLWDAPTGLVTATLAGTAITVARTSAGPGLAVQTWGENVQHLVVFGAGAQAECHIEIMQVALQRKIPRITIINRSRERAEQLQAKIIKEQSSSQEQQQVDVVLLSDTVAKHAALSTADVVAATTNTTTPLWEDGSILKKGCLITGIGSYTLDMQEIPASAVDRCHVVIDTPEAMAVGDLKHLGTSIEDAKVPITLAGYAFEHPELIGKDTDCIFYKAVGTAIQDVMTAKSVMNRAKEMGLGHEVDME